MLRRLQSLPERTATAAVHLLVGIAPAEAYLDCAIAALLAGIARNRSNVIYHLATNQLATKSTTSASWFVYAAQRLMKYNISIDSILGGTLRPNAAKPTIIRHWEYHLKAEAYEKSTLKHLNISECSLQRPHVLWTCSQDSLHRQRRSTIRVRLATGVYMLQSMRSAFNQHAVDPTCQLCGKAPEDLQHFLLHCETLARLRTTYQTGLAALVPGYYCLSGDSRIQLLLDHRLLGLRLNGSDDSCLDYTGSQRLYVTICTHTGSMQHLNAATTAATRAPTS